MLPDSSRQPATSTATQRHWVNLSPPSPPPVNILFIFNEYSLHNGIIETFIAARPQDTVSLVKVKMTLKGRSRLETAGKILPQLSRRFLTGKILEALVLLAVTLIPKLYHRGAIFRRLRQIAKKHQLPFHTTAHVLSSETIAFIRRQQPDLIITLVHQIIKAPLLGLPQLGIINIHPGLLPQFKGIQPYFWELSESSPEAGATLHLIEDASIDTGRILARKSYPTASVRSVHLNYYLTARTAATILPDTVHHLAAGTLIPIPQDPRTGNYYKWPDSSAYDRLSRSGRCLFSFRDLFAILTGKHD